MRRSERGEELSPLEEADASLRLLARRLPTYFEGVEGGGGSGSGESAGAGVGSRGAPAGVRWEYARECM